MKARMKELLIIVALLTGCNRQTETSTTNEQRDTLETEEKQVVPHNHIIEYTITQTVSIPPGFLIDTITEIDKGRNLFICIGLPVSGNPPIDQMVKEDIEEKKADFIKKLDESIATDKYMLRSSNSCFQVLPDLIYKDQKITSYRFLRSIYFAESVHCVSMYDVFNVDNKSLKRISLSDYFQIQTKSDTTFLIERINEAISANNVFVPDLKDREFTIEGDTISFDFDNYEIGSYAAGLIRGKIHKKTLGKKIKEAYR